MGCRKENWGREIQGNERVKPAVRGVTFGQTMDTTEMVNEIGSLKAPTSDHQHYGNGTKI